ncbi:MAG TPA: hypothetical protein VMZ71_05635 [Gemmataceae bacterium]|nr:hypothetical protein [Gemmataceae bacterium]
MTWLGKILAMLVMLLSLVWMYFTVNVYVTRTNWKTQRDMYKKGYDEAIAARESEYRVHQSADDAYARKMSALKTEADGLKAQYDTLMKANADNVASMKALATVIEQSDIKATQLQISLDSAIKEADAIRVRAVKLEEERIQLALKKEQAEKERLEAQNDLKLAVSRQEDAERRAERFQADLKELLAQGGGGGGLLGRAPLGKDGGPAPAEGTRGTVTKVDGDFVQLSIGIDAGLRAGMTLDLIRIETGKYLGTVTVQNTGLEPKRAVATFKPADTLRPINRLRPDELPKVGDQVTRVDTSRVSK